jgi:hypothetical protein
MASKMLESWEHVLERLLQRVLPQDQVTVQRKIDQIMKPTAMDAPQEAVGHFEWYVEVNNAANQVVARIICRGITLRTVYGPLMQGGMPAPKSGSVRYRIDKNKRVFVKG